jgi:hypothetical protein
MQTKPDEEESDHQVTIPRGRRLLAMVGGMPFTVAADQPDECYSDFYSKRKGGKRRTKKEWE